MLMGVSVAHLQSSDTLVLTPNERNVIKYEAIESYFKLVRNNNIGHAQVFGLEYFEFYLNLAKEGLNKENIVFPYPFQKVVKNYIYDITHDHDHPAFMQDELAIKIEMDHYSINFFQILNDLMLLTTSNLLKLWNEA
ncbi:MAG: hypothetical protein VR65_09085 [Desulfobulbaceae bacterium BRH_c16a]|nr:MAG: hypothetical protein VR65_13355 [Desulfobulbaceae bacterium BRH_c16a]KJS01538.1 MAG: hypothetical protein VR65_09085 [Desulfobulbaceae bacterium BRH_c16a]